jgi:AraC-like DNA-binding protein
MKKKSEARRKLDDAAWLRALRANETTCRVALANFSGRFRTPLKWATDTIVLRQHLVYFFTDHGARFQSGETNVACPLGSCFWVSPGTSFKFYAEGSQRPVIYRFRFEVNRGEQALVPPQPWYIFEEAGGVLETVKALAQETTASQPWEDELVRARLLQFSAEMFRKPAGLSAAGFSEAQRQALQDELDQHPAARLTAKDMARIVGLSADYFTRGFRRSYGLAPRAWLLRKRLRHAAILLDETTLRVGEIADRLGYDGTYLFSRQFRAEFGQSPRQWRQQNT